MPLAIAEIPDRGRRRSWILCRALQTLVQDARERRGRALAGGALLAVGVAATGWLVPLVGLLILVGVGSIKVLPIVRRFARGRVWELSAADAWNRGPVLAWAVITPHTLDRLAWRLDVTFHPRTQTADARWVDLLMSHVNAAVDVLGVVVESMDPRDHAMLGRHGYLPHHRPIGRNPVLVRFPQGLEPGGPESRELEDGRAAYEGSPYDLTKLFDLQAVIEKSSRAAHDAREDASWEHVVLRRQTRTWELARAHAVCLDGIIENLSIGRLRPEAFPGGAAALDVRFDRLVAGLEWLLARLRQQIAATSANLAQSGKPVLGWAVELANLEIDGLALAGWVAVGRSRSDPSLGILDAQSSGLIDLRARRVREHARHARRAFWFDSDLVGWWATAVASDALDLCGERVARLSLRRAVRRLSRNNERLALNVWQRDEGLSASSEAQIASASLLRASRATAARSTLAVPLAWLSATRTRRIGSARGAEGLRVKRLRSALLELAFNFCLALVIDAVLWALVVVARNGSAAPVLGWLEGAANVFFPDLRLPHGTFETWLGVSPSMAFDATRDLLAIVVTAAIALAVSSPREHSIRAWGQDRAWQVVILGVSYTASSAAVVLALAPLPLWSSGLDPTERAEMAAALLLALMCTAGAVSISALQTRLDDWNQRRKLSLAEPRLERARARLGPFPGWADIAVQALRCFAVCAGPPAAFVVLVLRLEGERMLVSEVLALLVVYAAPMVAVGLLAALRWAGAWGLAGRLSVPVSALLITVLLVFGLALAEATRTPSLVQEVAVVVFLFEPPLLFLVLLIVARVNSSKPRGRTGPATFALHLALRLAHRNYDLRTD